MKCTVDLFNSEKMEKIARVRLNRKQLLFLEKLAQCPVNCGGKRLSLNCVFNTVLEAMNKFTPDVSGVKSEKELMERFLTVRSGNLKISTDDTGGQKGVTINAKKTRRNQKI